MKQYLDLLRLVLENGEPMGDRTGTGTLVIPGHTLVLNLRKGFPLVTTKRIHFKSVAQELLWFLRGETNVQSLRQNGVTIWDEWADENGELGPVYGAQWRKWDAGEGRSIDQIRQLELELELHPSSRRLLVSAWNVGQLEKMALPPCHILFQLIPLGDKVLNMVMFQRSVDAFLGLPFNIASYALLLVMFAHAHGYTPGTLMMFLGNVHLYRNHLEQAALQLERQPLALPTLAIRGRQTSVLSIGYEDIVLTGYDPHPSIKAPISV